MTKRLLVNDYMFGCAQRFFALSFHNVDKKCHDFLPPFSIHLVLKELNK